MKTKVVLWVLLSILIFPIMTKSQEKVRQTAGHDALGEFAPEFAHLNDDILFGEVWSRNDLLSLRDRSICRCSHVTGVDRFFVQVSS